MSVAWKAECVSESESLPSSVALSRFRFLHLHPYILAEAAFWAAKKALSLSFAFFFSFRACVCVLSLSLFVCVCVCVRARASASLSSFSLFRSFICYPKISVHSFGSFRLIVSFPPMLSLSLSLLHACILHIAYCIWMRGHSFE